MVGTLDFQVKTLVFETWLRQCVVFLGKALYSHYASPPPPPGVRRGPPPPPENCQRRLTKYWLGGLGGLGRGGSDNMPP